MTVIRRGDFNPLLAYLAGVSLQCLSLLRKKPPKWSVITFFGLLAYMIFMMLYSILSINSEVLFNNIKSILITQGMSYGFVLAFLFMVIFLKEIVKIINESVIISVTLSYLFLLFETRHSLTGYGFVFAVILGLLFGFLSLYLLLSKKKLRNVYKLIFYGWYILVNGFFAVSYFNYLGLDFQSLPTAVGKSEVPVYKMAVLGMIAVQVLMSFGLLYYSFIYSLFSKDARDALLSYSEKIFSDDQFDIRNLGVMTFFQSSAFILVSFFLSKIAFEFLAFWILLSPAITRFFYKISAGFFRGSSENRV
ncbi:hypothetical protein JXL83_05630 [candidate division WOR-3 bacterium]|nr:hypothetical protein [candidate division WOR-3 bacterium]